MTLILSRHSTVSLLCPLQINVHQSLLSKVGFLRKFGFNLLKLTYSKALNCTASSCTGFEAARFCTFLHLFLIIEYLRYTDTCYKVLTLNSMDFFFFNTIQCDKSASAISRGFVGSLRGQILTWGWFLHITHDFKF